MGIRFSAFPTQRCGLIHAQQISNKFSKKFGVFFVIGKSHINLVVEQHQVSGTFAGTRQLLPDHQHGNVRYQHQSIRHQAKKASYQQQSIRDQRQMDRYQHHSIRHQHQMGRYQQQSIRHQRQMGRYQKYLT